MKRLTFIIGILLSGILISSIEADQNVTVVITVPSNSSNDDSIENEVESVENQTEPSEVESNENETESSEDESTESPNNSTEITTTPEPTTPSWENPDTCIGECRIPDPVSYSIYLAHRRCDKFCECSNGQPIVLSCPDGLNFNAELAVCDWPENVNCSITEVDYPDKPTIELLL